MRALVVVSVAFVVMIACGIGAYVALMCYLAYGQTAALGLVLISGGVGFLAPTVVARYLHKTSDREVFWRFSLSNMLIVMTVAAISLGLLSMLIRNLR